MIDTIQSILTEAFRPSHLQIIDESHKHRKHKGYIEGKKHMAISIQSSLLPTSLIQSHRAIHQALEELWPDLHALRIDIIQ